MSQTLVIGYDVTIVSRRTEVQASQVLYSLCGQVVLLRTGGGGPGNEQWYCATVWGNENLS